jgi:hypothetical protein
MPWSLAAIIVLAFALTFTAHSEDGPKDAVVLIIRHAERPDDRPSLAPRGDQRAQAYARYFREFTVESKPLRRDAIFAKADSAESQCPRLTVRPIAKAIGLAVNTRHGNKQIAELAGELRATQQGKRVLICWHHGKIPDPSGRSEQSPRLSCPTARGPAMVSIG